MRCIPLVLLAGCVVESGVSAPPEPVVPPELALRLDPQAIDFGEVSLFTTAAALVTLTNVGDGPVAVEEWVLDAPFGVDGPIPWLDAGDSRSIRVLYTPTEEAPAASELVVHSDAAPVSGHLSGVGVANDRPLDCFSELDDTGCGPGVAAVVGGVGHATVQDAIDAAAGYEAVAVCPGTWQPVVIDRPLALVGVGAGPVELTGDASGPVVQVTTRVRTCLRNLAVRGGNVGVDSYLGGPMDLIDVEVTGASTSGVNLGSGGLVERSRIVDNGEGNGQGAGIDTSGPLTVVDTAIERNFGGMGGGLQVTRTTVSLTRSTVTDNAAVQRGGGLALSKGEAVLVDTDVSGNTAEWGGAAYVLNSVLEITGGSVLRNHADAAVTLEVGTLRSDGARWGLGADDNTRVDVLDAMWGWTEDDVFDAFECTSELGCL